MTRERGSTLPLILGFVIIALLVVAGSVAAAQAFVQQRELQDACDGAAAAAASAADLDRGRPVAERSLRLAGVQAAVAAYQRRDVSRHAVRIRSTLSADARTVTLVCTQTRPIAFGAMFGRADGIRHVATSAARAPVLNR